ncbi:MAG: hypothetical protein JXR91_01405 [Deltaproteobacteria bacterium]|nr:hypothetical protein [Deltaproteobacteria bacterium]
MFHISKISFWVLLSALIFSTADFKVKADTPQDVLIIVNKSMNISSVNISDVKRVFLKEKTVLNGNKITPVNARNGSPLRKYFTEKVLGMSSSDESAYWEAQKIRTGVRQPTELSNTVKAVFSIKNGVSYCYRKDFNPAVAKIVLVI